MHYFLMISLILQRKLIALAFFIDWIDLKDFVFLFSSLCNRDRSVLQSLANQYSTILKRPWFSVDAHLPLRYSVFNWFVRMGLGAPSNVRIGEEVSSFLPLLAEVSLVGRWFGWKPSSIDKGCLVCVKAVCLGIVDESTLPEVTKLLGYLTNLEQFVVRLYRVEDRLFIDSSTLFNKLGSNLRVLDLKSCGNISECDLISLLRRSPELNSLSVNKMNSTEMLWKVLTVWCHKLTSLTCYKLASPLVLLHGQQRFRKFACMTVLDSMIVQCLLWFHDTTLKSLNVYEDTHPHDSVSDYMKRGMHLNLDEFAVEMGFNLRNYVDWGVGKNISRRFSGFQFRTNRVEHCRMRLNEIVTSISLWNTSLEKSEILKLHRLRSFIASNANLSTSLFCGICTNNPLLTEIDVSSNRALDDSILWGLESLQCLSTLNLSHCDKLTDYLLSDLAQHCTTLTDLNVSNTKFDVYGLCPMLQTNKIRTLKMNNSTVFNIAGRILNILMEAKHVELLEICHRLGNTEVEDNLDMILRNYCPRLIWLEFRSDISGIRKKMRRFQCQARKWHNPEFTVIVKKYGRSRRRFWR